MIESIPAAQLPTRLQALQAPGRGEFLRVLDAATQPFEADGLEREIATLRDVCRQGSQLLATLPLRSQRDPADKLAGETVVQLMANARRSFFRHHAVALYADLTAHGSSSLRVDRLLWDAAQRLPDILPTQAELAVEAELQPRHHERGLTV